MAIQGVTLHGILGFNADTHLKTKQKWRDGIKAPGGGGGEEGGGG